MDWEECLEDAVKVKRKDSQEAQALLKMAEKREAYISSIQPREEFTSFIVEDYYEIIKELLTALLSADGYKSYSHECLITFLEKFYPFTKDQLTLIDQLRKIRNDINYRGVSVDYSYLERNEDIIRQIIKELKALIRQKLES